MSEMEMTPGPYFPAYLFGGRAAIPQPTATVPADSGTTCLSLTFHKYPRVDDRCGGGTWSVEGCSRLVFHVENDRRQRHPWNIRLPFMRVKELVWIEVDLKKFYHLEEINSLSCTRPATVRSYSPLHWMMMRRW